MLAFVDWVWSLQWRERLRSDPTIGWQRDISWSEEGRDAEVMRPGETVPWNIHDELLPEHVGLLDTQLYWPGAVPCGS